MKPVMHAARDKSSSPRSGQNRCARAAPADPNSAASALKFGAILSGGHQVTLQFTAMANRTYSIMAASTVNAEVWFNVANIAAAPTNRVVSVNQPVGETTFFRLVAPGQ